MAITDDDLLEKVKTGLSVGGNYNDGTLKIKTVAVKHFMLNAGITEEQITSDLGIATLTIGVTDLWNLSPGEVKFSEAFLNILMPQLMVISIPETGG